MSVWEFVANIWCAFLCTLTFEGPTWVIEKLSGLLVTAVVPV